MLEKILDAFFLTMFFLVTGILILMLLAGFIQAYHSIVYKVYKEANDKCYVMHGRLLTTDSKYICYGAPVNGQPVVYFEMNKPYK
jgi:hypothetical protein